jgi:P4 family phage/plasmid primase-like protien
VTAVYVPDTLFAAGFTDLISVIPPGAALQPTSTISPAHVGKVPGRRTGAGLWAGYDWRKARHTAEEVHAWQMSGANVGLRADRFPAVDIDCQDESLVAIIKDAALAQLGVAPCRTGKAPKQLLMYRTHEPFGRMRLWIQRDDVSHLVEILGEGQQYVVFGTHPVTERAYAWDTDTRTLKADALTLITRDQADEFLTYLSEMLDLLGGWTMSREGDGRSLARPAGDQDGLKAPSIDVLRDAVRAIPNTNALFPARSDYLKVGYAIRAAAGDEAEEGFHIFAEWAARWEGNAQFVANDADTVRADWRRMRAPFAVGWNYLAELARGFGFQVAREEFGATEAPKATEILEAAPLGSDQHLAERVADRQRRQLRFVPQKGCYLVWNAGRWQMDAELLAEDLIKRELKQMGIERLRSAGASAGERKKAEEEARAICAAGKVNAVAQLVRSDRSIAIGVSALDHDPWLLNTPGGLVDLRSGDVLPADPDALATKITAVPADFSAECPRWQAFLREATGGDADLALYLQRLAGYCLTGSTREQHLTFIHGPGGNGKSVFLNVLTGILGDYAETAAMDTFTAQRGSQHSTDIASLSGARLVTASETESGKRWDEQRVKGLTGGEPVKARFLYQNNFTFLPQFKLVFVGNHRPELRDVDAAMRRRIHIVPFVSAPVVVDRELGAKLREEWPAILAWMVRGCLAWEAEGLNPPESVREATEEYFADEDAIGRWMRDCLDSIPTARETTQGLFRSWQEWAEQTGEYVGTQKRLSAALIARKLERWQENTTRRRGFRGVHIKDPAALEALV